MNFKKLIANIALMALCCPSPVLAQKQKQAAAADAWWITPEGVSYSVCEHPSQVVRIALDLFGQDMKEVTGSKTREKTNAPIQILQLNTLTDKEFEAMQRMGIPYQRFITRKDAFLLCVRGGRVIVAGSDARGTAYGIMELSRLAGVSPWTWWNDAHPAPVKQMKMAAGYESLQVPSIEYRAVQLLDPNMVKPGQMHQLFRLMLRLRANTLWEGDEYKASADSFDICLGSQHQIMDTQLSKNKKKIKRHKQKIQDHSTWTWNDESTWMADTQPGLLYNDLITKGNKGEYNVWVIGIHHPKCATYNLQLFTDLAWNNASVRATTLTKHLQNWLAGHFGAQTAQKLLPVMTEYYRLTAIRKPESMNQLYGEMEFNSGEFGNELERYLLMYDQLKEKVANIEKTIPATQRDAFFEIIKYPVYASASVAEKELEAQESRYITRPGLFDKDTEARIAAALSLNAYQQLKSLTAYYDQRVAGGKWQGWMLSGHNVFQAPRLPGKLTTDEVKRYASERNDRRNLAPLNILNANFEARNASKYATVYGKGVLGIPLLGHGNSAVSLLGETSLNYTFWTAQGGDICFTLATIPVDAHAKTDMRVSVTIDQREPVIFKLREDYGSEAWQESKNRGQTLRSFFVTLSKGSHNIKIRALDDQIAIDQLMLDYDVTRQYYMIPTYGVIQ